MLLYLKPHTHVSRQWIFHTNTRLSTVHSLLFCRNVAPTFTQNMEDRNKLEEFSLNTLLCRLRFVAIRVINLANQYQFYALPSTAALIFIELVNKLPCFVSFTLLTITNRTLITITKWVLITLLITLGSTYATYIKQI